jgi:pimeloyl-ACP methyl ester carboxylesterase
MKLDDVPSVPGVSHRYVEVGDVRLHVAEAGTGPPLVLIHGWPQHWWCWRNLIPRLAEHYRVFAPDLRGWGWSDAPAGDYAKATWAADIRALIQAEGLDRVDVIAHDWGGHTAFLLALEHPELIARMVVLDMPPPWAFAPRPAPIALASLLSYQLLLATPFLGPRVMTSGKWFIRSIIKLGSGRRMRWSERDLDVYADVLREPARARASSACYRTFLTRESRATARAHLASELTVPTLLMMGGESVLQRALAPRAAAQLRVESVAGAGHFLAEEEPEQVLQAALAHLRAST